MRKNTAFPIRPQVPVSYKERDELIKDVEVKYPQKKKADPATEIEVSSMMKNLMNDQSKKS